MATVKTALFYPNMENFWDHYYKSHSILGQHTQKNSLPKDVHPLVEQRQR